MKTSYAKFTPLMASIAAFGLTLAPAAFAQTADQTSNTKTLNTVDSPNNQSSTTGAPGAGASTLDKTNSKDPNALDKNPGSADSGSATASATKDPTMATTPEHHEKMSKSEKSEKDKPMSDKQFVETAAQGGMTEVQLGKLAEEKGASSEVKDFGTGMVTDHTKANAELASIAEKKGLMVPDKLDAKHQAMVDKFEHLSGPAFDKAYVHAMVRDHEKTADCFRTESTTSQDPELKTFAGDTLKTVEMHLSHIKSIQSSMK